MLGRFRTHINFLFFVYETDNKIGDDGAKAIAEALKKNTALEELVLRSKYHTQSPSFSHDSRFDVASCLYDDRENLSSSKCDGLQQDGLRCVVFYCVRGSGIV